MINQYHFAEISSIFKETTIILYVMEYQTACWLFFVRWDSAVIASATVEAVDRLNPRSQFHFTAHYCTRYPWRPWEQIACWSCWSRFNRHPNFQIQAKIWIFWKFENFNKFSFSFRSTQLCNEYVQYVREVK